MPLTTSTKWDNVRNDLAAREHTIVKVTDGTDTWLFSDVEMELTDGHVYNVLKSWGDIASGVDIFSRKWLAQHIQVRLSNHNYRKDTTADGWKRLGDDLSGIYGRDAEIYLMKGNNIDALADCLKRFAGKVGAPPSFDADFVTITLVSKQKYLDKKLPSTLLNTIYTTPLPNDVTAKIPLVYGQFTGDFTTPKRSGLGLVVSLPTVRGAGSYVISDHILKAFSKAYGLPPQIKEVVEFEAPTLAVDSAGRGRMTATGSLVIGQFYPTHTDDDDYDTTPVGASVTNAVDRDVNTSVQVNTYEVGDVGGITPKAIMMLGFDISALLSEIHEDSHTEYKLSTHCDNNVAYIITSNKRRFYYYHDDVYGDIFIEETMPLSDAYDDSAAWTKLPAIIPPSILSDDTEITGYRFISEGPAFTGDLNDMTMNNVYTGAAGDAGWTVEIDGTGTPNTFKWRKAAESDTTGVNITGSAQLLKEGVEVTFAQTINHTSGDKWTFSSHNNLNDIGVSGTFTGTNDVTYKMQLTSLGVNNNFCTVTRDGTVLTASFPCQTVAQQIDDGVMVLFGAKTGHNLNDVWLIRAIASKQKNADFMIGCYAEGKTSEAPVDDWLFEINEVRLKLKFLFNGDWPVFAACDGLAYAAWIDSRSSNYASTNLIEDPVGICESILRDQLAQVTADIDEVSFVNAENTSVKARMNLHDGNAMSAFDAIRQVSEQSTFCFSFGPDAKSRVIDLADKSPTTTRTIPFSHIVKDSIRVGKTSTVRNLLHIDSLWQNEYESYAEQTTVEDTTSTADVGIGDRVYNAKWPNIAGTSKDNVSANLVNTTDGIWSKRHTVLDLKLLGFIHADLIEGDWIELDAPSVDHHIKAYGASWSGIQLLIVNVKQGQKHTQLKAVELW